MVWVCACTTGKKEQHAKLAASLAYAGSNAAALKDVIAHYSRSPGDSLKLQAALFLIENMPGKGSTKYTAVTNRGAFNTDLFKGAAIGIDSLNKYKKKMEDSLQCGLIRYVDPTFLADARVMSAKWLIENIDYAFKAWELPWARSLTFDEFKELILPYRVQIEPLQHWRKQFFENSGWILQRAGDTIDRIKIATIINDSLSRYYHYIHDAITYFPGSFTVDQMKMTHGGRCEDLNMLVGYWLRAVGIPTASEFTSYWANSNYGGHSWLSVLDTTGKFVPLNAVYDPPVRNALPFKGARLAKAYRNTYHIEDGADISKTGSFSNYIDVSDAYLKVINYTFTSRPPSSQQIYLGVLNGEFWKPLEMKSVKTGDSITFYSINTGVIYAPLIVLDAGAAKTQTVGPPFFVSAKGQIQYLKENKQTTTNVSFDIAQLSGSLYQRKCQVVYWDHSAQRWLPAGTPGILRDDPSKLQKERITKMFTFAGVPEHAIYRLINAEKVQDDKSWGRPFIYDEELKEFVDY
ncbi:hypothetical protein SAMN04488122_2484 [Chitinophaga arvensicola]|uniref:Transglutaminase-like superfamily protein n=2 Tax=Chitinophaga arvensicola TaxID=29529 RepID=A0A1I0R9E0_9BACT|nr:hypothetical protein SAMN04488122_2484 [Chitinophaga arvensicola]